MEQVGHVVTTRPGQASARIRYDGLDMLRAGAILLGVFSHAARSYVPGIARYYPIVDPASHELLGVLSGVVNSFRMQLFFALSGFFAHLVLERRGTGAFLRDRARRLVVPFLAALPLLFAFDWAVRAWSESRGLTSPLYRWHGHWQPAPLHLWFLEYLFLYCVIAWGFARFGVTGARPSAWLARALRRPEVLLPLALPLALALAMGRGLNPARSFLPQPMTSLEYACYFAFGWLLWDARGALDVLARRGAWLAAAGLALVTGLFVAGVERTPAGLFLEAFAPWAISLGAIGLALRVAPASRPLLRFVVDASYWVYLVHFPIVQLMQTALGSLAWPAIPKFFCVVAVTFAVTLASFALWIRGSVLGEWLGAKRRPAEPVESAGTPDLEPIG